jgi:hypothetical protein
VTPAEQTFNGTTYLVVPVVALVEGVIHAANAADPEFVPEDVLLDTPEGWNGRPVFHGHPQVNGEYVSGNSPEVLESAVGLVFNAGEKNDKLAMEAWVAKEQATPSGQELAERLLAGEAVEISVGAFVESTEEAGTFRGLSYTRKWERVIPDHLALLRADEVGACSRKMGCGVRAAKGASDAMSGKQIDKSHGNVFSRIMNAIRGLQSAEDMSDRDVQRKLHMATMEKDPRCQYIEAVYDGYYVYAAYADGKYKCFKRDYTLGENGAVTIGDSATEVEPVVYYEPVDGSVTAARAAGACTCQHNQPETKEVTMACKTKVAAFIEKAKGRITGTVEAATKFLEGLTDEQFASIEQLAEPVETVKEVEKVVEKVVEKEVQVQIGAPKTLAEAVAMIPEAERAPFQAFTQAQADRKAATIKALRASDRCKFSDEQLQAKSQDELDQLVSLAGSTVDYSGAGVPRASKTSSKDTDAPAPRSLTAELQAKKAKQ